MRIGIDAREIENGVYTGIGRPLANFLAYFDRQTTDDTIVLFSTKPVPLTFSPRIKNIVLPRTLTIWWDQVVLPRALVKKRIDVYYSPYYKIPLSSRCPSASAVLDLMYLADDYYRQHLSTFEKAYYFTMAKACVRRATRVLTCSHHSKQDIIRFYGVAAERITVIPLSVADIFYQPVSQEMVATIKKAYGVPGHYLLCVGNLKRHKNIMNVLYAFQMIADTHPDLSLVIVGPKEHLYDTLVEKCAALTLSGKVVFTDTVTDPVIQAALYSGAEVFLMPSLYEGFGLPAAEAMAAGTPVIVSDRTSQPEVVWDAGLTVDPTSAHAIADAINRIITDENVRRTLREKGRARAALFSNAQVGKQLYDFLVDTYTQGKRS